MLGVKRNITTKNVRYKIKSINGFIAVEICLGEFNAFIVPLYLRSANWAKDFENVKQLLDITKHESVALIGDINIRIGELQQEIIPLFMEKFPSGLARRSSKDKVCNGRGRTYTEFCNENNMIILNGQTKGDEEGNFTFISYAGKSVNDICSISQSLLQSVEDFTVEDKIWSDHMPIVLTLKLDFWGNNANKLKLLPKLMWKESERNNYQCNLNRNLQEMSIVNETLTLKHLTDVIIKSATKVQITPTYTKKNKWFNDRCHWARKKVFASLHKFRKTNNEADKSTYLKAQKEYKLICESSKQMYYDAITRKLNCIHNGEEWWTLAKEIGNQSTQISPQVDAKTLSNYFRTLLNPEQNAQIIYYAPMLTNNFLLDADITVAEIKSILSSVKLNKAPGEDRIPYEFFINSTDNFLQKLAQVYNHIYTHGDIDEAIIRTVIFPIHKKGALNEVSNYRGISFINCVAKIFMGILNERLFNWAEEEKVLSEYQAGFRRGYSTTDNLYTLASIVHLKLAEKKKVYAFFVDFKAAFDMVCRRLMIYKMHQLGISYKFVRMINNIYENTLSAVWTGEELSDYFETTSGVKQGCLLSPLLFALYMNDIHDALRGGVIIDDINIRVLLYADDIVIIAEERSELQSMIQNLEHYCNDWNLTVNTNKSKILVFRKGGKLSEHERWTYRGEEIEVVSEYKYLGVIITPQMKFRSHIRNRNIQSKSAIKTTWKNFLQKDNINLWQKWNLYQAVCRSIQSYAAQIWGYGNFEEVDKLQRYFLKKVLHLPDTTPNYALAIETGLEEGHLYTLNLHLNYIKRTLFKYHQERLPCRMTKIIIQKNLFWAKDINNMLREIDQQPISMSATVSFGYTKWSLLQSNFGLMSATVSFGYTKWSLLQSNFGLVIHNNT
ncbi:uncharacterized protein LOC142235800 [Haematobia irritans]|uniref:uncharacterized protein LOC142235800 n=1 Tax=Haematobia irritans TaxID=7368 RepID=UPI003F50B102